MVDDDSQVSASHASNGQADTMTTLDSNLKIQLLGMKSQNKKRQGSDTVATTSPFFQDSKRSKRTTMADLIDSSDDDIKLVDRLLTEQPLSKVFVRDDRRTRPTPHHGNDDEDSMLDELGLTRDILQGPRNKSKRAGRSDHSDDPDEIPESPQAEDHQTSYADIPVTSFRHEKAPAKSIKGAAKHISKAGQDDNYPLIFYQDILIKIDKPVMLSVNAQDVFSLSFPGERAIAHIDPAKVKIVSWAPGKSNLVRISGVRVAGRSLTWHLEFDNDQVCSSFVARLKDLTTVQIKPRSA